MLFTNAIIHLAAALPSLQDVMSFTTRSQLVSSGDRIAWVESTRGEVNVYGALESTGFEPFPLLSANNSWTREDACKDITIVGFWSADLLHVRVSMRDGTNALHLPDPLNSGDGLYAVAFRAHSTATLLTALPIESIAHGRALYASVAAAPPSAALGTGVAQINVATLLPSGVALDANGFAPLLRSLSGTFSDFAWSPDGQSLAFTSQRGDHALLGVVALARDVAPLASGRITWIAPSHDSDVGPVWSHDGTQIAWRREFDMTGVDGRDSRCVKLGYCGHAGAAYAIMVVSLARGVGRAERAATVLVASNVRTLFADNATGYADDVAGYGARPLAWSADDDDVLFPCETSGYVHVVAVAAASAAAGAARARAVDRARALSVVPRDLTPEPCDNQAWGVNAVEGALYVVHNCDLVDSLGVAAINVKSGVRTRVLVARNTTVQGMTTALGIAHVDAGLVYVETTWANSTVLKLLPRGAAHSTAGGNGSARLLTPPRTVSRFDNSAFVVPTLVTLTAADGVVVHAQLFTPAGVDVDRAPPGAGRPAIVFTHGGSQRQMYAAFHYDECYAQLYSQNQYFAQLGFVVLSINYRGGPGCVCTPLPGRLFRSSALSSRAPSFFSPASPPQRGTTSRRRRFAAAYSRSRVPHPLLLILLLLPLLLCLSRYGVPFRAANNSMWEGAAEYQDVLAGGLWLGARAAVDAARIGIYGLSYGGLNAMQALTRNSDVFAAGVANAPVFNWISQYRFDDEAAPFELARRRGAAFRHLPVGPRSDLAGPDWLGHTQRNIALAWSSSPAGHLAKLTSPLLTIQGDADQDVDFQESAGIVAGLRARGFAKVEALVYPDESHGLSRFSNQVEAAQATCDFFIEHLGAPEYE